MKHTDFNLIPLQIPDFKLFMGYLQEEKALKKENRTSRGTAGSIARGILETQYGFHFCDCLNTGGNEGFKSNPTGNPDAFAEMFGGSIVVNPNPAKNWTAFEYTLSGSKTDGIIKITDVTGNIVQTFTVTGEQGTKIWDTRKIKPGIYFYEFVVNGYSNTGKL